LPALAFDRSRLFYFKNHHDLDMTTSESLLNWFVPSACCSPSCAQIPSETKVSPFLCFLVQLTRRPRAQQCVGYLEFISNKFS
jgi:hypothetical protein